jgi:hypothetical protein
MRVRKADIEMLFDVVPSRGSGNEVVIICPTPGCGDETGNRSINLQSGKTNCFRCNVGGDFYRWAKNLGHHVSAGEIGSSSTDDLLLALRPPAKEITLRPVLSEIKLPTYCHRLSDNMENAYARSIEKMAIKKRLTMHDMVEADVMFTRLDPLWEDYAIFPIYEWEKLVMFQGRLMVDDSNRVGKRFPSNTVTKFGSKYWVYNIDQLREEGGVAVVMESILNVLSLRKKLRQLKVTGMVPVCVFKHALSKSQASKILSCRKVNEVCFLYDADATIDARRQAIRLSSQLPCTVAEMPRIAGKPNLDPNDDVDAAWAAIKRRLRPSMSQLLVSSVEA